MKIKYILLYIISFLNFLSCSSDKSNNQAKDNSDIISENKTQKGTLVAAVLLDDQWMYINEQGDKLFGKNFTFASDFQDGIACVAEDGTRMLNSVIGAHYYGMNTKGEKIKKIKSDTPFEFSEERAFITQGPRTYLINTKGEVIKFVDGAVGSLPFSEGRGIISVGGLAQIWDKQGNVLKEGLNYQLRSPSEGLITFKDGDKSGYLNKNGEIVKEPVYKESYSFEEGFGRVKEEDGSQYFINKNFEKVLGPFEDCWGVREGLIAVKTNGVWQYLNKEGNIAIEEKFDFADSFYDGYAIVVKLNKQLGIIDKEGNFTPVDARVAINFQNGLAIAEKNKKLGFINTKGRWVIPAKYYRLNNFNKL